VGYVVSVLDIIAVPAVYLGNDFMEAVIAGGNASSGFYSHIFSIAGLAYTVWLIIVSISMIRKA